VLRLQDPAAGGAVADTALEGKQAAEGLAEKGPERPLLAGGYRAGDQVRRAQRPRGRL